MQEIDELLSSVRSTYAEASTYSDSGRVLFVGGALDGTSAVFTTRFERRGRVLSLRYVEEAGTISLEAIGDRIAIAPAALHDLARANDLGSAIAVLTGVTSSVAHNVFSMLLPNVVGGPSPCADSRDYRMKEAPAAGRGLWVVETSGEEPRTEIVIGPDMLLRGYNIRGIVTGTTDILIEYQPRVE